jgi:hypothetical protein
VQGDHVGVEPGVRLRSRRGSVVGVCVLCGVWRMGKAHAHGMGTDRPTGRLER